MATGAFEAYLDFLPGMAAGVDLTGKRFHLAMMDADTGHVVLAGADDASIGVINTTPNKVGEAVNVAFQGISKCVAGGAIARGAFVKPNAAGRAVTAAAGDATIGYALTKAENNGDVFTLVITNSGAAA
jgi:hypothetical protein